MSDSGTFSLAATVLMLRDTEVGPEVFMIKRHQNMNFAAGALVFPGGRLDQADGDESRLQYCTGASHLSAQERALRVCAIRETFEESGILLAHDGDAPEFLSGDRVRDLQAQYRDKLNQGDINIWDIASAENLKLACENLTLFAHWITPEGRPRRYDTMFYLVAAPVEQTASHDRSESVDSTWTLPSKALQDADAGIWTIVFVTRSNLARLSDNGRDVAALIRHAEETEVVPLTPKLTPDSGGIRFSIPPGHGYGLTELRQDVNLT